MEKKLHDILESLVRLYEPLNKGDSAAPTPDWDEYFYAVATIVQIKSKDKDRKVGCVIVGDGHIILSTGYNGFPRGIRETSERVTEKREKLGWITHAETNAIFNAARSGTSLVGTTLYVTTYPCSTCAQAIIQAGIRHVYTLGEYWLNDLHGYDKAPAMFAEAGIAVNAPNIRAKDMELRAAESSRRADNDKEKQAADGLLSTDSATISLDDSTSPRLSTKG